MKSARVLFLKSLSPHKASQECIKHAHLNWTVIILTKPRLEPRAVRSKTLSSIFLKTKLTWKILIFFGKSPKRCMKDVVWLAGNLNFVTSRGYTGPNHNRGGTIIATPNHSSLLRRIRAQLYLYAQTDNAQRTPKSCKISLWYYFLVPFGQQLSVNVKIVENFHLI